MADCPKEPIKIYGNDALSTRVDLFQKKASEHKVKQKANPFSGSHTASYRQVLNKSDPNYGRPPEGSKTEMRGLQAGKHISGEVQFLCDMIYQYGHLLPDGRVIIPFGELFEMYTRISNKVVGILLRARKHGFVDFEGEILFQRKDDHVLITLIVPIEELHEIFGIKGPLPKRMVDENENEEEEDEVL